MDIEQMALMIPILMIVLGVGVGIVAIVTSHREKQQRIELRHRERLVAIEKGIDLPLDPEPATEPKTGASLRGGLMGLFVGVVLYFALEEVANVDVAIFGLIPAAAGLASLISYFVELKRNAGAK